MGYSRAGFDVVGVDIKHQKNYPFEFIQGDALDYLREHGAEFDAIHASPPCQAYTSLQRMPNTRKDHPQLVDATREALEATGLPWVIENVPGAPLIEPAVLCGTMFGLGDDELELRRHRLFETNWEMGLTPQCCHTKKRSCAVYGNHGGRHRRVAQITGDSGGTSTRDKWTPRVSAAQGRAVMGIEWMTWAELAQAIPPAFTEFIGRRLMVELCGATR